MHSSNHSSAIINIQTHKMRTIDGKVNRSAYTYKR